MPLDIEDVQSATRSLAPDIRAGPLPVWSCAQLLTPAWRPLFTRELPRIVPKAKFGRLPPHHPVFQAWFKFERGLPHMKGKPHGLWALVLEGRVLAMLSPIDLHCGWTDGDTWFGMGKTEEALKMGTNIYIFAMTQAFAPE